MRCLLPLLLLVPGLAGQATICHALNDNLNFDNNSSMGGPNLLLAIQTTAPVALTATRIEVFTGEQTGSNSIALWTHDPVGNRPLLSLGSGSWSMSRINGWQGANLATPISIAAGQTFWVVWSPINGAQASHQGGTGGPVYRGSFDGGASWNGPFQSIQWKFRIWCGGPVGHYETFGAGCRLSTRTTPELGWFGLPRTGSSFQVLLERGLASSFALLTIGDSDTTWAGNALPFSLASFGAAGCNVLASVGESLFTPTDVTGQAVLTLNVPMSASLLGLQFYDQWFVHDPAANALQFAVSNGGRGLIGS
ncbi:MAG: hypothetical protein IPK26_04260 [Planctomycetes bacterium]|nr:hypothetical protein [Planctomycetota bacterium]